MRIDATLWGGIKGAGEAARELEAAGYDGAWTAETSHDPFLPLVQAAANTSTIEIGTSIAVAFARNPMLLANLGWDLQAFSGGRFNLGHVGCLCQWHGRRLPLQQYQPAFATDPRRAGRTKRRHQGQQTLGMD